MPTDIAGDDGVTGSPKPDRPPSVVRRGRLEAAGCPTYPRCRPLSTCAGCEGNRARATWALRISPFKPSGPGGKDLQLVSGVDMGRMGNDSRF